MMTPARILRIGAAAFAVVAALLICLLAGRAFSASPVNVILSPEIVNVTVEQEGAPTVTVTTSVGEVLNVVTAGEQGIPGAASTVPGPAGPGVPAGGTDGQVLLKSGATDYVTVWGAAANGVSSWNDLTDKPSIPAAQVNSDWNAAGTIAEILNKPTLFSGVYSDLTGLPALFSGSYTDLTNKPTIPAAQVNSDWTASGTVAEILNKPAFGRGYDGREVELQKSATHVQWRFVGDTAWTNLIALAEITGSNGSNGANGKTYSCAITGGIRALQYDKNGSNPAPAMTAFGVELREDGSVVTPSTYAWSVPASNSLLSGSSSSATFTPTVNGTFTTASDNRVDVAVTYAGITCQATAPVPATKVGADGLQGSTDTKQQIYTKINVATTGDVLNTQAGSGDADGFAFRTVRAKGGDIHRTDLAVGQTWVYARPTDAATAAKFGIKNSGGTPVIQFNADGSFTGTLVIR